MTSYESNVVQTLASNGNSDAHVHLLHANQILLFIPSSMSPGYSLKNWDLPEGHPSLKRSSTIGGQNYSQIGLSAQLAAELSTEK